MSETWSSDLAGIVAAALAELTPKFAGNQIAMLSLDCHPWHGTLSLCVLTESECANDPELRDPAEMAAWRFFDCSDRLAAWAPVSALSESMHAAYGSSDDNSSVAATYLQHCADALTHPDVTEAISKLDTSPHFRLSITHPDDGTEFCGP